MTATSTTETAIELPKRVYQMVMNDSDVIDFMSPWSQNGCLYICDGRIAIELYEVAPWPGINCRVHLENGWFHFEDQSKPARRAPPNVKRVIDEVWQPCKGDVPEIAKPKDTNDGWLRHGECKDCDGYGEDECNMGHTHVCPTCDGTGEADEIDSSAFEAIEIEGVKYSKRYIWIISQLPEAKLGKPAWQDESGTWKAMAFEFNGGRGALMPMEGKA